MIQTNADRITTALSTVATSNTSGHAESRDEGAAPAASWDDFTPPEELDLT